MKNFNGVPPRDKEFIADEAQMNYGQAPYTYDEIPVEEDVLAFYGGGGPQ
jgi:hypothetical protein